MADDGVKISALNEILTEPATGEMAAVVSGGVTYKRDIGKRLPSTTQKSALAGYGGTPSSTNPYATQSVVKPLSDLSRVFHLTGDGIPTFPDNVAGAGYFNNIFANTDSWASTNGTVSASNGILSSSYTSGSVFNLNRNIATTSGKEVVLLVSKTGAINSVDFEYKISGTYYTIAGIPVTEQFTIVPLLIPTAGDVDYIAIRGNGPSAGAKLNIKGIYIGSGLFDTPVYGADGQSIWTNHGVLAVPGDRGNAMLLQSAQYLESPISLVNVGRIALKIKRNVVSSSLERLISDLSFSLHLGISVFITAVNELAFIYGTGTTEDIKITSVIIDNLNWHSIDFHFTDTQLLLYYDGTLVYTVSKNAIVQSSGGTYIGRASHYAGEYFNGLIADPRCDYGTWTSDDALRYHNGDDAVNSQQKSTTGAPNAIATYANDGFLGEHGTFTPIVSFGYNSAGVTYEFRNGYYNRIGKTVFFTATFKLTNKGSSTSNFRVGGLPYTSKAGVSYTSVTLAYCAGVSHQSILTAMIGESSKMIDFFDTSTSGAPIALNETNFSNDAFVMMSGFYFIE